MPAKKSAFRKPGARHFQLVHRSQRDPLIHDPEASQHVLKSFERENVKKGKSRTELETYLTPSELAHDLERVNIGQAASYGVYYDDTEYDYMQHLKQAGVMEEGVESVLIESPVPKTKNKSPLHLRDIPSEALPSTSELPRDYDAQRAVPSSIAGFQPEMDPHLRQVLEALEDEAFVDDELEDDFFSELVAVGERDEEEPYDFEFREEGVYDEDEELQNEDLELEQNWEARFKQFKHARRLASPPSDASSDLEDGSEGGDTVGGLPHIAVIGGKRRRRKSSDASGYSMSSSSMYRNEHLSVLDERFDQIEKDYGSEEEDEDELEHSDDEAPRLMESREDFEAMLDEFLQDYEILGGKMKAVLSGDNAAEKLNTLRRAMGQDERTRVERDNEKDDDEPHEFIALSADAKQDRWDCETILTTYSNLDNHPRMIKARETKSVPKIRLDRRTGLPIVEEKAVEMSYPTIIKDRREEDEEPSSIRMTVARPRAETKEDKKLRKQAVKADRRVRRADKKSTKEQFSTEFKRQSDSLAHKGNTAMRKL